ncbi:hypothetical protein [Bradyrhizobium erythrophlei]|uniref:hypothetical protein n=1 Tax=Bradyrhizobium erythrophlei TaxID=1437360 RepID=UPI00115FA4A9|nr:hypothetical protein [Bradyrhizobium erythrophlei]
MIKDSSTHFDCLISGVFNHAAEPGRAIRDRIDLVVSSTVANAPHHVAAEQRHRIVVIEKAWRLDILRHRHSPFDSVSKHHNLSQI